MKVAIVRYVRNPDNYFFDLFDATAAGALRQAGHEAQVVERTLAPGFDETELMDGLLTAVRRLHADLVILSYVPDRELPRLLYEHTGAVLATYGSRLLLELPHIDYVLAEPDPLAVVELVEALAGRRPLAGVAALAWRDGEEIRRSGKPLHTIFEIFTAARPDYSAFRRLGPGKPPELRKHIAGDWGCPYRHARHDDSPPHPATAPPEVPRGGCTFCTRPNWSPLDWELKKHVLEVQLDAVLAAFPNLAKLIYIDEYGLADIDRFAQLLLSRPVEGMRILLSGRLEHLPRHAGALSSAAELLKEKCTFRLYQFGIENLAESALARYNKGLDYPTIRRSLAKMDELVARHPNIEVEQSFGFLLFDPWTTPEELRINVRRAGEMGLNRYRGQAPFTALRLAPEMALYWRAREEGLLVEDLADNAFGYSVHSGWRFQHPETEAIHRRLMAARGTGDPWHLLARALDEA